jgi:O-methyltransferase
MIYKSLLSQYPIISDQIDKPALGVVLRELEKVLGQGIVGEVVEFGCYIGTTSLFIRRLLDELSLAEGRDFYAYDSFAGLPEKATQDNSAAGEEFKAGELAVSKKDFLRSFQKANLKAPITHKSWFNDLKPTQLPEKLAYAFLDGDFYDSILDSLNLVWPLLSPGGVVTIDDYERPALPGVTLATQTFLSGKAKELHSEHGIAIIKKL